MGKMFEGLYFAWFCFYIQQHKVDLRCGAGGDSSLNKNFGRFLVYKLFWSSRYGCAFLEILTSHHSAWRAVQKYESTHPEYGKQSFLHGPWGFLQQSDRTIFSSLKGKGF
jgi:hypothetical protein